MIILDTHIWIWWIHGDTHLPNAHRAYIEAHETQGLGISIISCWELAKLAEYGRLSLPCPVAKWLELAISYPGIRILELTPQIIVDSTQLPGVFHRDPADQLIVATSRIHQCPLLTLDSKILSYPHVQTAP